MAGPTTSLVTVALVVAAGASAGGFSVPFVADGGIEGGLSSGLWGDGASGPDGMHLGCLAGRRYAYVVTMTNRSSGPVTVTGARGSNPTPRIVDRVAIQLRLAAPRAEGSAVVTNLRRWSRARAVPVTVPPGRSLAVQSNFLMRNCASLADDATVVVPGSFLLGYRTAAGTGSQLVTQASARIILTRGPRIRRCRPVPRSSRLVAADVRCSVAGRAAVRCRRLPHRTWGRCSTAGRTWNCSFSARGWPSVETCWLGTKREWFKVRWTR